METEKKSVTLTVAWVLLLIIGLLIVLGGAGSMVLGFRFRTRICRRRSALGESRQLLMLSPAAFLFAGLP